jgi:uncharacterized protein (UPF0333 family)
LSYVGDTEKYLKRDVHPLMPSKLKGMTSLEVAIIIAIVLVIAVAVGWYLYTTFVATTTTQGRLAVSSAEYDSVSKVLTLHVTNPGPQEVTITTVVLHGIKCGDVSIKLQVGESKRFTASGCSVSATPGTMIPGYIVTTVGTTFPFTAVVR